MNEIYKYTSITFRVLYSIVALVILIFNVVFSNVTEENESSLVLPFLFCIFCVFIITVFHKAKLESVWSKVLQIFAAIIILITLIGSVYLSIVTLKNNGSLFALLLFIILALTSIPLIYFVVRNRKYGHYC